MSTIFTNDWHIKKLAQQFWQRHYTILEQHGIGSNDVSQQAWLEYLVLHDKRGTDSTKYVYNRLIDWMRHMTQYCHITKTCPVVVHLEDAPEYGGRNTTMDVETPEIIRKVCEHGDDRTKKVVLWTQEGYTFYEIGEFLEISNARVSQLYKKLICQVKRVLR
jgi:hypothetical protein